MKFIFHTFLLTQIALAANIALGDAETLTIVTLGDSITKGVRPGVEADETFAACLQSELDELGIEADVMNVGIGGETVDRGLARLEEAVLALDPDDVTIMYGTNDSYVDQGGTESRLSTDVFRLNLEALIDGLREAGVEPILMTEPCYAVDGPRNGLGEDCNVRLEEYMEITRLIAAEKETLLIDNFQVWSAAAAEGIDLNEWTTDGYHPNPEGHRQIAKTILEALRPALTIPSEM